MRCSVQSKVNIFPQLEQSTNTTVRFCGSGEVMGRETELFGPDCWSERQQTGSRLGLSRQTARRQSGLQAQPQLEVVSRGNAFWINIL